MTHSVTTTHHTIVVRRSYVAPVSHVYSAWRDPAALARWYVPGDATWSSEILEHAFRIGGRKYIVFGPRGGERYFEDCRYEDIVENHRICFAMTIRRESARITTSMVTVEFAAAETSTEVKVTDQLVVLDGGDTGADRERGWGETLDKLTTELRRH